MTNPFEKLTDDQLIEAANANALRVHGEIRAVNQWALFLWGNDDDGGRVECDYCAVTLVNAFEPLNIEILYRAVSQHRMDGCPNAPTTG